MMISCLHFEMQLAVDTALMRISRHSNRLAIDRHTLDSIWLVLALVSGTENVGG